MMQSLALLADHDETQITYVYAGFAWWTFLTGVAIGLAVMGIAGWGFGLWRSRGSEQRGVFSQPELGLPPDVVPPSAALAPPRPDTTQGDE